MLTLRKSEERGYADHGWLKSFHSFSFANYHDPRHMGFGNLRVINEDRIAPGTGFGTHGHRDMEIISYVLAGSLAHRDTLGNVEAIPPGDVQRMSAGTGVRHSEFNHQQDAPTHFLQIWIEPDRRGIEPGYEERHFPEAEKRGVLRLVASPDGAESAELSLPPGRKGYVHLVRGELRVNGRPLAAGDAAMIDDEAQLRLDGGKDAEVLVFDLGG